MEPIIEIMTKNILKNKKYNQFLKNEYITTFNRMISVKINIIQMYRSMDYNLLYNVLYEEILYLIKQQQYFNKHLDEDVRSVLSEYFDAKIKQYNHYIGKL
jgi:hypothetical protein